MTLHEPERSDPAPHSEPFGRGLPPFPEDRPARFRATVHGTIFAERALALERLATGDGVMLIPDPPVEEEPRVWVHLTTGEPVGYLPTEIGDWLAPWLLRGEGPGRRCSGCPEPTRRAGAASWWRWPAGTGGPCQKVETPSDPREGAAVVSVVTNGSPARTRILDPSTARWARIWSKRGRSPPGSTSPAPVFPSNWET
jgi:hypothetical protein